MKRIMDLKLGENQAALWFIGQAGHVARSGDVTLAIDPYLSDSCGTSNPACARTYPTPIAPEELKVDIIIITHDHLDHLDYETLGPYQHKKTTTFVAPRLAAKRLATMGIPKENIVRVDTGETETVRGVSISGIFALPTSADVLDTAGYKVEFANGRSFYHSSDTAYCRLLLQAAPYAEVLLVAINGKWGNLNVEQAVELTEAVAPKYVIPNHYDVMAINSENPETFRFFYRGDNCVIPKVMEPFVWE